MGTNSKLKAAFKSEIFTVSFVPIWVIFQNSVTYIHDIPLISLMQYDTKIHNGDLQ